MSKPIYNVVEGQPMMPPRWESDDYIPTTGETDKIPQSGRNGLYNPVWQNGNWIGDVTKPVEPTAEQQALTALAQQIADSDKENKTQLTSIEKALTALATGGNE